MLLILPSKRFSIFLVNHLTPGREIEAPENRLKFQPAPLTVVDDQRQQPRRITRRSGRQQEKVP